MSLTRYQAQQIAAFAWAWSNVQQRMSIIAEPCETGYTAKYDPAMTPEQRWYRASQFDTLREVQGWLSYGAGQDVEQEGAQESDGASAAETGTDELG